MTFGSLFAGIGGLDLGLERAGMAWTVHTKNAHQAGFDLMWEYDEDFPNTKKAVRELYKKRYPDAKIVWIKKGYHVPDREGDFSMRISTASNIPHYAFERRRGRINAGNAPNIQK